jgi:hypothetical protein
VQKVVADTEVQAWAVGAAAADLPRKEPPPVAAAPIGKYPVGKYPLASIRLANTHSPS